MGFELFVNLLQTFYVNDCDVISGMEGFSCFYFNKLNEDLSGKVDKISSIYSIPSTFELGLIFPAEDDLNDVVVISISIFPGDIQNTGPGSGFVLFRPVNHKLAKPMVI